MEEIERILQENGFKKISKGGITGVEGASLLLIEKENSVIIIDYNENFSDPRDKYLFRVYTKKSN